MSIFKNTVTFLSITLLVFIFTSNFALAQAITGGVSLFIEPTSYVPPMYKGEALFTKQGTMRIVAIPYINGRVANPRNFIFKWTQDDIVLGDDSGAGKNSIIIDGSIPLADIPIQVDVSDSSGHKIATQSELIKLNDPLVLFYEENPLYGVLFNRAIFGNYNLGTKENLTLIAKPYFFNVTSDFDSSISYAWSLNGNSVNANGRSNALLLKQTDTGAGSALVSVDVKNIKRIFQYTSRDLNVYFGQ